MLEGAKLPLFSVSLAPVMYGNRNSNFASLLFCLHCFLISNLIEVMSPFLASRGCDGAIFLGSPDRLLLFFIVYAYFWLWKFHSTWAWSEICREKLDWILNCKQEGYFWSKTFLFGKALRIKSTLLNVSPCIFLGWHDVRQIFEVLNSSLCIQHVFWLVVHVDAVNCTSSQIFPSTKPLNSFRSRSEDKYLGVIYQTEKKIICSFKMCLLKCPVSSIDTVLDLIRKWTKYVTPFLSIITQQPCRDRTKPQSLEGSFEQGQ